MANIDSPLFQYLQDIPEGPTKVAIEHLFDLMRQVRTRTGGDSDLVATLDSETAVNFYAGALIEPIPDDVSNYEFDEDPKKSIEFNQRYALLVS